MRKSIMQVSGEGGQCPCGLDRGYVDCCGLLHRGDEAAQTPEAVMRSRYAAFVQGEVDYLWETLHTSHDDHARGREAYCKSVHNNAEQLTYRALHILDTADEDRDGVAYVLFLADLRHGGRDASFVELSGFAEEGGVWRYLMGTPIPRREVQLKGLDCPKFMALLQSR